MITLIIVIVIQILTSILTQILILIEEGSGQVPAAVAEGAPQVRRARVGVAHVGPAVCVYNLPPLIINPP